jgi:hypothetical protein
MKTVAMLILLFFNSILFADETSTTEQLFTACSKKENKSYGQYCLGAMAGYKHSINEIITVYARGYANGVASTGKNIDDYLNYKTLDMSYYTIIKTYGCVRDQTESELAGAFIKWMNNHPTEMDKTLLFTARQAFLEHFPPPCEKWE